MFSIGENGDIYIFEDGTFADSVIGDNMESSFRMARNRIISYFKYRNFLEKKFIKSFRNKYTDGEIRNIIEVELKKLFSDNMQLNDKIRFYFKNDETIFEIVFLFKMSKRINKNLCFFTINC